MAAAVATVAILAACTTGSPRLVDHATGPPNPTSGPAALTPGPLCTPAPRSTEEPSAGATLPRELQSVAAQVERVRGLTFAQPVVPQGLGRAELERTLREGLARQFPASTARRQERALITLGALPQGTDLRQAVIEFGTSQIVGFYDSNTHRLVFQIGASPTPFQRFILAHELTHALDDQRFDLGRLSDLGDACQDERYQAFLALAEGDAVETQLQWARVNLSAEEIVQLQTEAASYPSAPPSVPPFIEQTFSFPYPNGQAFVEALLARGGSRAVNEAFRSPPTSTEQILHPDKYPDDQPQDVEVPDLSGDLGAGWSAIDREGAGEGFLQILLGLRLGADRADRAAAGWDGGQFMAWSNGSRTAVLMRTVWDADAEAAEFADAMREWTRGRIAEVSVAGSSVDVRFGSDRRALAQLDAAA